MRLTAPTKDMNFHSPIAGEIKDTDGISRLFSTYRVVPFFGTNEASSDSFLQFLVKLSEISPTVAGCIQSRRDFVASGIELHKGQRAGFSNMPNNEAGTSDADIAAYQDFVDEVTGGEGMSRIKQIVERIHDNLDVCGNAFIEIAHTEVAGRVYSSINVYDATECRYLLTEEGEAKRLLVSPSFDLYYLSKYPPSVVPLFPEFQEVKGAMRSIIHIKENAVGRRWYGLNKSISSLYYQYLEYSNPEYLVKETHNRFTGKVMFDYEVFPDDSEEDLESMERDFANAFTPAGLSKSYILSGRPAGAEPIAVTKFEANTNEKYHVAMARLSEDKITASFAWFVKLLYERNNSSLSGDEMKSLFMIASQRVKPRQDKIINAVNKALHACADAIGRPEVKEYNLRLASLYKLMFKDELEAQKESNQSNQSNSTPQDPTNP